MFQYLMRTDYEIYYYTYDSLLFELGTEIDRRANQIHRLDIRQTSESKRDVVYGQDCDDTEYRNEWGTINWKNYGRWLSECDSIQSVTLDKEFAPKEQNNDKEKKPHKIV